MRLKIQPATNGEWLEGGKSGYRNSKSDGNLSHIQISNI